MRILLVGMMGVGKSTVGRALAERNGWPLLDTDVEVERRTGRTVAELFAERDEAGFRAEEAAAIREIVGGPEPLVVSVAGGAVLDAGTRALLAEAGLVVWLRATADVISKRVGDGRTRPLLGADPRAAIDRLLPQREGLYAELADVTVDVDGVRVEAICERIEDLVAPGAAGS